MTETMVRAATKIIDRAEKARAGAGRVVTCPRDRQTTPPLGDKVSVRDDHDNRLISN